MNNIEPSSHPNSGNVPQLKFLDWSKVSAVLSWVYDAEVLQSYRSGRIHMSGQSCFLIESGGVLIETERGRVKVGPGNWVFPRQGERLQSFIPESRILSIHFQLHWPGGLPFFDWDVAVVMPQEEALALEAKTREISSFIEKAFLVHPLEIRMASCTWMTHIRLQSLFHDWLILWFDLLEANGYRAKRFGNIDPLALSIVEALDRHSLEIEFTENELARQCNQSTAQMMRAFKREFNMTPRQYLEKRRTNEAIIRLTASHDPIKQIASELGFRSLSNFSAWCRKRTNCSPRTLRQQHLLQRGS